MRNHKKRFLYPFNRDHLDRLDRHLEMANVALHAALQMAELEISMVTQTLIQEIQLNASTSDSTVLRIEEKLDKHFSVAQENNMIMQSDCCKSWFQNRTR
ncbi:hypothetical protein CkaCkLH20_07148 [Colletotrichum karsti]|uniref:Uncharacterized protein n=1 Tax=Colletotrichum karsti TaxID=1095194 RepID=A0A9P6I2M7_9PEZI|nr:uncharacterized protein CkaCkLH20_07148 [Colletotrichum karsti]KAF9875328.1 hypothetical protein CkaCkLH20_07148 [Colletotrichum karsti]